MKKQLILIAALVVANMAMAFADTTIIQSGYVLLPTIDETLVGDRECKSGGPGSTQCSTDAGIAIDGGASTGCSVTCANDYYACCGINCTCLHYKTVKWGEHSVK